MALHSLLELDGELKLAIVTNKKLFRHLIRATYLYCWHFINCILKLYSASSAVKNTTSHFVSTTSRTVAHELAQSTEHDANILRGDRTETSSGRSRFKRHFKVCCYTITQHDHVWNVKVIQFLVWIFEPTVHAVPCFSDLYHFALFLNFVFPIWHANTEPDSWLIKQILILGNSAFQECQEIISSQCSLSVQYMPFCP